MAHIILFDNEVRDSLLPLTFTRPVCELRIGALKIREKWERWLNGQIAYITQDYLAESFPIDYDDANYVINGSVMPSAQLCRLLKQMDFNEAFLAGEELIAAKLDERQFERLIHDEDIKEIQGRDLEDTQYLKVNNLWDLFLVNDQAIREDFELLTKGRTSQPISATNQVIGKNQVFLEEGAKVECAVLNASTGPIYIGKNAEIMEGCLLRGPIAIGEGAVLKMGAKVYGATTIGPYSKIGGEVKNVVIQGYSNKGHDGYLGNAVLGSWCNLGAGTSCSNLKNTYSEAKMWNYASGEFEPTGQQFLGLVMGDHSKSAVNTSFNTGSVVGVASNIFSSKMPPKFVPSFTWLGDEAPETHRTDKAFEMIEKVMEARKVSFSVSERLMMLRVFEDTTKNRTWEKE